VALVKCEVIGQLPIVDAETGTDVVKPHVVTLDDEKTNIPALVQAGLVTVLREKTAK
jgi:hypothetical protein